jgi:DNA-directed RNA polymerase subunit beta
MSQANTNISMFVLPDFVEIQVGSFCRFLESAILEELQKFPIIKLTTSSGEIFEFQILAEHYCLIEPLLNEREAVYQSTTYASDLYVPIKLTNLKNGKSRSQIVCLGSLPFMTSRGTFVINGVSWTIVNQILVNAGVYFGVKRNGIYTATILCSDSNKRIWIEIDKKGYISVRMNKRRKFQLVLLLLALGLEADEIPANIIQRTKKLDELITEKDVLLLDLYKNLPRSNPKMRKPKPELLTIANQIQNLWFQIYTLGQVGRFNFNRRLWLDETENETQLRPKDLIKVADCLINISLGMGDIDDIDHLKNKHVISISDMLRKQLGVLLMNLKIQIEKSMKKLLPWNDLLPPKSLMASRSLTRAFNQFFGSHELIQFLDQTNPLGEVAHKRKISLLGPGGLTRRTASFKTRDIHPSHYGRICTIETSEGMNAGVICSLASCATINAEGVIQNPFHSIYGSLKNHHTIYVGAGEDESLRIGTDSRLAIGQIWQKMSTSTQYQQEFVNMSWDEIHLRSILPLQYFAIGASLIPFLEHNDATRALMGSNMQRQAVPLLKPEKPIVGTGLEAHVALDSGTVVIAPEDGQIRYLDGEQIVLVTKDSKLISLKLLIYERSNNGTCINQRVLVNIGDFVRKGQILADGAATVGGELALGKNVLVAYMPWEGYNFEDAILISERLVYEDIYTSIHIEKYETSAQETNEGSEIITRKIPQLDKHVLRHLDANGIVSIGSWVEAGDVLVGKLLVGKLATLESEKSFRSGERKLLQAIFDVEAIPSRENCLKLPTLQRGRVIDVRWVEQSNNFTQTVHIYVLQKRRIQVGDKVAGRHGNKGIVSRILPREDMPYLQNGTSIDMVLSPLGVPSRMNVGQLFECLLGLAGSLLNKHYRIMPFDERYERESSRKLVFSELYDARKLNGYPWLFEPNSPGKSKLFDGRTGEVFDEPITVGKAYMMKLIHQVDDKIHARSIGPYALVTQQPLRGRANRGGQRVGEMEVWAFEGFGAAYMLQEMLTIKSDHVVGRSKVLGAIVTKDIIPKSIGPCESFRLLIRELRCLGIEISHTIISEPNLNIEQVPI